MQLKNTPRLVLATLAALACHRTSAATPPAAPEPPALTSVASPSPAMPSRPSTPSEPRAPSPACVAGTAPGEPVPVDRLVERAADEFNAGHFDRTLDCAMEAIRADPATVAAHHYRAAALVELGRYEEARLAYSHAMALDPTDPEVLRSSADLLVRHLGGREELEIAVVYCQRALPVARLRKDTALEAELDLIAAMALNDLGRPAEALPAATRAVELDPDTDSRRERGVALFELVRFEEADAEFAKVEATGPDAWTEHYLGLIAERRGDEKLAKSHFARARTLDPEAFPASVDAPPPQFIALVDDVKKQLPLDIQRDLARSQFLVEDLPRTDDLVAVDPPLSPGILGLFRPPPDGAPENAKPAIVLYRRNLARACKSGDELRREVRDTLLHEVGHLRGEDDDELRDRGL